jgi:protein-L-isoaspartate(D-aspartate) O-methyltransferase
MAQSPPPEKKWLSTAYKASAGALANNASVARPQAKLYAPGGVAPTGAGLDSSRIRANMVDRLMAQGLDSEAVRDAMLRVERHRFVDSGLINQAYEDTSLPIGLGQTISKPSVVARMLALLVAGQQLPMGRLLEIGTGCGYQAAVMGYLAKEVYSIERLKGLHDRARANLRPFQRPNIHLIMADGHLGYPAGAPYAGIVAAAGGEAIPQAWLDQLAIGGRLVAPCQNGPGQQRLVVVDRTADGYVRHELEAVLFVPLKSGVA